MKLSEIISKMGYRQIPEEYKGRIELWKSWYRGNVEKFHKYKIYNGKTSQECQRATLNMGKQACEYWADLLWNSECTVAVLTIS